MVTNSAARPNPIFRVCGWHGSGSRWVYIFLLALIGACLSSFANVAALRSLDGRDWYAPSTCYHCGLRLSFLQNLPIYGYLRHAGMSACCGKIAAALSLCRAGHGGALAHRLAEFAHVGFRFCAFVLMMVIIFLTDFDAFIIPDWTSLGGLGLGLALALIEAPGLPDITTALLGGALGYGLIFFINLTYKLLRGRDGMGGGDVKLMAMLGVWLGPLSLLPILFSASMAGAFIGIAAILLNRMQNSEAAPAQLPFGCFLCPMALCWLFFAPMVLQPTQ